ncbi:DUF1998 domain-containing protein [Nannocystis sp.]|uniref:DUF1998 domain-containing protein n=1 Tax=Nannocystis sp. TaxID=1962667 RepID=UPI00344F5352
MEPPAGPLGQQRLLRPGHARHLPARGRRGRAQGRRRIVGRRARLRRRYRRADQAPPQEQAEGLEQARRIERRRHLGRGRAPPPRLRARQEDQGRRARDPARLRTRGRPRRGAGQRLLRPRPPARPARAGLRGRLDRVVLVHKLREVVAQIGFTRFEAVMPDIDGELTLDVRPAALSREPTWVPAVENRGEGVFLGFSNDAIAAWLRRDRVQARGDQLLKGFDAWAGARRLDNAKFPGLPYLMLHSLAHLLIQAVALECGYAATAISERVYAGAAGHGILLYTGTPGSEGTLGGLVAVGKRIEHYLATALELGRLCSNDPICAQHRPDDRHEERFLHGAACHGCLLIAEPSCERRNELLDRALVVATVDELGAEFFVDP